MPSVSLRELNVNDLDLLLAWAHIPDIWVYMPTSRRNENLSWEEHLKWWYGRKNRRDWMIKYYVGNRSVGVIHASDLLTERPEIGLYVGELGLWDDGVGERALLEVIDILKSSNYLWARAVIHPDNIRSIRLFTKCGFIRISKGRKGQDIYEINLGTIDRPKSTVRSSQERDRLSLKPIPA